MKKEKLFELLADMDEEEIEKAGNYAVKEDIAAAVGKTKEGVHADHRRKSSRGWAKYGSIAAAMVVLLLGAWLLWPEGAGTDGQEGKDGEMSTSIDGTAFDLTESTNESSTEPEVEVKVSNPRDWTEEDAVWMKEVSVIDASIPEPVAAGMSAEEYVNSEEYYQWGSHTTEVNYRNEALQRLDSMQNFYDSIAKSMLTRGEDNMICSPLNIYMALSLLSETTNGNSRKQILDFLSVEDMDTLRGNVDALWNSNFVDTPLVQSYLANSLWLNEDVQYEMDTLERLANDYHASSFIGKPGSAEMDQGLRSWTNKATGGLLKDDVQGMHINPETVLELVSTIYYHAMWTNKFSASATTKEAFHGTKGDTEVDMMHMSKWMNVYRSEKVTALRLTLENGGYMYFYLPAEGADIAEFAADPELNDIEYLRLKRSIEWYEHYAEWRNSGLSDEEIVNLMTEKEREAGWFMPLVNMSIPRFHIDQKTDLLQLLTENGITDIMNPDSADFSPLTKAVENIYVSKADHAATLEIDEKGVKGAAYVDIMLEGATLAQPEEEIDFVLDRPFLFAVYSEDGSILFQGIIRNID